MFTILHPLPLGSALCSHQYKGRSRQYNAPCYTPLVSLFNRCQAIIVTSNARCFMQWTQARHKRLSMTLRCACMQAMWPEDYHAGSWDLLYSWGRPDSVRFPAPTAGCRPYSTWRWSGWGVSHVLCVPRTYLRLVHVTESTLFCCRGARAHSFHKYEKIKDMKDVVLCGRAWYMVKSLGALPYEDVKMHVGWLQG